MDWKTIISTATTPLLPKITYATEGTVSTEFISVALIEFGYVCQDIVCSSTAAPNPKVVEKQKGKVNVSSSAFKYDYMSGFGLTQQREPSKYPLTVDFGSAAIALWKSLVRS